MSLQHCSLDGKAMVFVPATEETTEGYPDPASTVTNEFTVRCLECGARTTWSLVNVKKALAAAKLAGSVVAQEIQDALRGWGFPTQL